MPLLLWLLGLLVVLLGTRDLLVDLLKMIIERFFQTCGPLLFGGCLSVGLEGTVGDLKVTLIVKLLALLLKGVVERALTRRGDLIRYPILRAGTLC